MKKIRVLVIAEAANPEWSSVPLIGWELSQAISKVAEVHLVTQIRNREALIRRGLKEGGNFTAIDNESHASRLYSLATILRGGEGKGWTTVSALSSLAYYSFEARLWKAFRQRLIAKEFDIVHRVTPVSPTSQSILAKRLKNIGIPFVVGPLNGGVPWPKSFRSRQHAEHEWLSYVRKLYKFMPAYKSMRSCSSAIIVGSRFTERDMPQWCRQRCVYIPENGVNLKRFDQPRKARIIECLRGAFVGRLVPYKGADILIRASAPLMRANRLKLDILGDGPQMPDLRRLVEQEGVTKAVCFHGWVLHEQIQEHLRNCDFLALPSVREFGGGVVLEAMSLGVMPIVANYGGPSELVDDDTGIRVEFDDEHSLTTGFQKVFEHLSKEPELLNSLGANSRQKALNFFSWDQKAEQILSVYRAVLKGESNFSKLGL